MQEQSLPSRHLTRRYLPARYLPLLATLSCLLLLADDVIQQWFTSINHAELELRYVLVLWLFSLGLWLAANRWLTALVLTLLAGMQLIQLGNMAYTGMPLLPSDLSGLFGEFADVQQTAVAQLGNHWHVLPSVLLPYGALFVLHMSLTPRISPRARWVGWILVLIVLAAKPYRATYRDMTHFMPGPTRSSLHNSLNSFAFYAVNLAGREQQALPQSPFQPYQVSFAAPTAKHVWIVMADSLRSDRLGVMGYQRDTTPFLSGLRDDGELLVRQGIAAGVSTAVSLPVFLNLIREPGQNHLLREQPHNLFRLGREQGFNTFWLSSQESKLLTFAGKRFIDVSITREDFPLLFSQRQDHALSDLLPRKQWGERNLVMINLRTAHSPYDHNYENHDEPIARWPTDGPLSRDVREGNAYDNAVRYFDDVVADIVAQFDQLEGERYLLITGDHGQLLGENEVWGHNRLLPPVVDVPVMVLARDAPQGALDDLAGQRWVSHYEAGLWLAQRLGARVVNPNADPAVHFVKGKLLLGDNSIMQVKESGEGLQFSEPMLLSKWLQGPAQRTLPAPDQPADPG